MVVGSDDGMNDGRSVGIWLGRNDGADEGYADGIMLGSKDGIDVGEMEGKVDGSELGFKVGNDEGLFEGYEVGILLGDTEGAKKTVCLNFSGTCWSNIPKTRSVTFRDCFSSAEIESGESFFDVDSVFLGCLSIFW